MIQLLIVAAILGIIYFALQGGDTKVERKPEPVYREEIQRVQGLEQTMMQAVDQKKRYIDQQPSQD